MTPSLPTPSLSHVPPWALDGPPAGRLGPGFASDSTVDHLPSTFVDVVTVWYLASCYRCGGQDLAQPFRDLVERDEWAVKHAEATGHVVHLGVDGMPADLHQSGQIRYFEFGAMWRWACPATDCATRRDGSIKWYGPYDSGQLALAAWRSHGGPQ